MRAFLKRTVLVLGLIVLTQTTAFAGSHVYNLHVDGLACPFCAYGVEKQLSNLDNVKSVEILMNEGIVAVTMAADKPLSEADAKQAINDAGFSLRKFEASKTQ